MKDKKLREELDRLGIIKINFLNYEIRPGTDNFKQMEILDRKVNLIMEYLGLEIETGMRLKKISKSK